MEDAGGRGLRPQEPRSGVVQFARALLVPSFPARFDC
jgi:hypothetical protein